MYLGIDIGGTKTLLGLFDAHGKLNQKIRITTDKDYRTFIKNLLNQIEKIPSNDLTGIGIAIPGIVDYSSNKILALANLDWKNVDIIADIKSKLPIPAYLENDANTASLFEANQGSGKNHKVVLYLTISTGIGSSICINGTIPSGLQNSEAGHMIFKHSDSYQAWENFASGKAFFEKYKQQAKEVNNATIWEEYTKELVCGIFNLLAVVQPNIVVIGGSIGTHFDKFEQYLLVELHKFKFKTVSIPPIVKAKKPELASLYGTISLIQSKLAQANSLTK
jgi:predicted NBD/HSP70 family sugar kinase